ncbi:hypothetical protein FRC02_000185 [Tulasnella sp. 418]|nr:hypothetical protein FRC02_000185 [Tulasnella sp. 418]
MWWWMRRPRPTGFSLLLRIFSVCSYTLSRSLLLFDSLGIRLFSYCSYYTTFSDHHLHHKRNPHDHIAEYRPFSLPDRRYPPRKKWYKTNAARHRWYLEVGKAR